MSQMNAIYLLITVWTAHLPRTASRPGHSTLHQAHVPAHLGRGTCGKYIGCHAEAGCPAHYKNVDQESLIDDSQTGLKQNLKNT